MDQLIVAIDTVKCAEEDIICTPEFVNELFETHTETILGVDVNRAMILMILAAVIVVAMLFFAFRRQRLVPTKFGAAIESLVRYIRDEVAIGIIGPEGVKYAPYLISLFLFILVGNLFEITPLINFPITSRMAIPAFLAIVTWIIFIVAGIAKQGLGYFGHMVWPPGVPTALKPLVGLIELVSIIFVRPFSLAVRLFANLVAGHVMLSLLLVSSYAFITALEAKAIVGVAWGVMGLAIFLFEIIVSVLQAYIFTLLSAVYIQTSIHPEH